MVRGAVSVCLSGHLISDVSFKVFTAKTSLVMLKLHLQLSFHAFVDRRCGLCAVSEHNQGQ
jgi:hypothetical protein